MTHLDKICIEDIEGSEIPGISKATGAYLCEGCVVCLSRQSLYSGVNCSLKGDDELDFHLLWETEYTDQMNRSWNDQEVATEHGAACLSILVCLKLTDYTIIERARKTTGIDYWLGNKDSLLFQHAARLEVSGIFDNPSRVKERVEKKIKQTSQSDTTDLPAYISIVEFSSPSITFFKKK